VHRMAQIRFHIAATLLAALAVAQALPPDPVLGKDATYILRCLHDAAMRDRVHLLLNRGESRHELARRLFFANQGAFRTGDHGEIMNKVSALALLSNAVLAWNTVQLSEILASIEASGQVVHPGAPRAHLAARSRARDPQRHLQLRPGDCSGSWVAPHSRCALDLHGSRTYYPTQ